MNRFYVVAFAVGAAAVPVGLYLNAQDGVHVPPAVQIAGPRDGRGRFGRGGYVAVTSAGDPAFILTNVINFAQPVQLPPCSVATSGVYDSECIAQCGLFPWVAGYDGGINCYNADGGTGDMVMTQSNVLAINPSSPFYRPDGGWLPVQGYTDDTSGTAATTQVDSPTIRAAFGGPHTIVFTGYFSSTGPDPTGWAAMITDGTNQMQLRRGAGNNLQFLETPNVAVSGGECLDNWCVIVARNGGDGGINVRQAGDTSTPAATTIAAVTGSNKLFLGGGVGGCCAPAGAMGGPLGPFTMYRTYKSDAVSLSFDRGLWGAQAVATGPFQEVGDVGVRLARYDLDKPGGELPVFGIGDYFMDPVTGAHTNQTYHVLGPADSLDGGTLSGGCVWRGHFDKGPFYDWRHQNAAGVLSHESNGACAMSLGSVGGDAGIIDTNASFIGTAFTDGGYGRGGEYWIQNLCPGGTIDGGFDHCTGAVTGNAAFARYPIDGCPMVCFGATGSVQSLLYIGDAGATSALEIAQVQMSDTLEIEPPSVTNAQVSAQWLEVDAGSFVPSGCNAGKVTAVWLNDFSTGWYPPGGGPTNALQPPGTAAYLFDMSNSASSHDMLQWLSTENTNETSDAGSASVLDGLVYGSDPNYTTPNKFSQSGQYDGVPFQAVTRTYYASSLEWDVETGVRPDGGVGTGSRAIESANACADQTRPGACQATALMIKNTGQMGLCPGTPDTFEVGTRQNGTSPSTSHVHHVNICRCPSARCAGDCK